MTNEEKAVKLALEKYPERLTSDREFDLYENDRRIFMQGSLEMAEWKDHQFKDYMEKKKADFPSFGFLLGERAEGYQDGYRCCIEQIINEFFGEE